MRRTQPRNRAAKMILELMQDRGLTRRRFAKKFRLSLSLVDKLVTGARSLTWRVAHIIERGSGGAVLAQDLMEAAEEPLPKENKSND